MGEAIALSADEGQYLSAIDGTGTLRATGGGANIWETFYLVAR